LQLARPLVAIALLATPYLTAEGVRIFGGSRPKGDADGQQ
jgi:hypothetical protein